MKNDKILAQLKALRKRNKITIIELAKKMGVSQSYLVQVESGVHKLTEEQIETIMAFVEGKL
ncbi:MAG: helix-turn-helix domain-containing protein [Candidatus Omnitrophica bacterium]|nr:helix-turn-helix domain-containing protein [Candidatus Omnitrophota bacterium]